MHTYNWQGQGSPSHNTLWFCTIIISSMPYMYPTCIKVSSHLGDYRNICGKHVTETVSEMASSFALFKPASMGNIKETDTGAHCRTQSVKPSTTRGLLSEQENTERCLKLDCCRCVAFHPICLTV